MVAIFRDERDRQDAVELDCIAAVQVVLSVLLRLIPGFVHMFDICCLNATLITPRFILIIYPRWYSSVCCNNSAQYFNAFPWDPFYWHGLSLIPSGKCKHMRSNVWDEIIIMLRPHAFDSECSDIWFFKRYISFQIVCPVYASLVDISTCINHDICWSSATISMNVLNSIYSVNWCNNLWNVSIISK